MELFRDHCVDEDVFGIKNNQYKCKQLNTKTSSAFMFLTLASLFLLLGLCAHTKSHVIIMEVS
jgi:hypothetical protein